MEIVDIQENHLLEIDKRLLPILLMDYSSNKNIIWATDNYEDLGELYGENCEITPDLITGEKGNVILPRSEKSKEQQRLRSREKAEVFTPSWICNMQNNLVDSVWFGRKTNLFNRETENGWKTIKKAVAFPEGKSWESYVLEKRLEITCGEAPYLVSRYDTVTGDFIKVSDRIGLLDRKLRIISENITDEVQWLSWVERALKATYGFEWQGDNLLLARENILYTIIDHYEEKYSKSIDPEYLVNCAIIISWNLWQMDGIKFVIPNSCTDEIIETMTFFGTDYSKVICPGCEKENHFLHNGVYSKIMDWEENKAIRFVDIFGGKFNV